MAESMDLEMSEERDVPSDFFDDFSKDEFMAGLDVVDSWDDSSKQQDDPDLRTLLRTRKEEAAAAHHRRRRTPERRRSRSPRRRSPGPGRKSPHRIVRSPVRTQRHSPYRPRLRSRSPKRRSRSPKNRSRCSPEPCRRRDTEKMIRDIKKDKEIKVKEYLAKRLESDISPPGTELDDYLNGIKKRVLNEQKSQSPRNRASHRRRSPSPRRRSPSPRRRSPSPRHRRSGSMHRPNSEHRRSSSRGYPHPNQQDIPYPNQGHPPSYLDYMPQQCYLSRPVDFFPPPPPVLSGGPGPYIPGPGFNNFNYGPGPVNIPPSAGPGYNNMQYGPGPVNVPPSQFAYESAPSPMLPVPSRVPVPAMVPVPQPVPAPVSTNHSKDTTLPAVQQPDALDQLLADGKISKEDYLKLTPKGRPLTAVNLKDKVNLLSRCHDAVVKLGKLHLPNRLIMGNLLLEPEVKAIAPKFCSPLKRQPVVNFQFTTPKSTTTMNQNKQLVDSIVATIELQQIVAKPPKKQNSKFCDVAVQTTTPFCESCEIRLATKCDDKGTSVDADHFSSSVHTQVIEAELASSKTMFNPVGNSLEPMSGSMSLSHLTPAQIVSQLAARAKKLETGPSDESDVFMRRRDHVPFHYQQQNNYRYQ